MSDPPGRENPKGRRWFRAAVEQFASDRRGTFAPPPNRANENPRRDPKIPDGVFHALTSRKVAALESKTSEQRLRSGRFKIFLARDPLPVPLIFGRCPATIAKRRRCLLTTMQGGAYEKSTCHRGCCRHRWRHHHHCAGTVARPWSRPGVWSGCRRYRGRRRRCLRPILWLWARLRLLRSPILWTGLLRTRTLRLLWRTRFTAPVLLTLGIWKDPSIFPGFLR